MKKRLVQYLLSKSKVRQYLKRRQPRDQSALREEVNPSPGIEGPSAGQSPSENGKMETGGAFSAAAVQWGLSEMPQQRQYRLFTPVPDIPNSPRGKLIPDRNHRGWCSNLNWCFATLTWVGCGDQDGAML